MKKKVDPLWLHKEIIDSYMKGEFNVKTKRDRTKTPSVSSSVRKKRTKSSNSKDIKPKA